MHILVLTDRDWSHPQGGGTGTNLYAQVSRWLRWGHRVSVIACAYPGCSPHERVGELEVHRVGGRSTVFPRAIWRQWRGLVRDPDVVLEVINGITFLTPLWLRAPRLALVHHIHRDHYAAEMGRSGVVAAALLETLPLRTLYARAPFITISEATADDISALGIPREQIAVNYIGVELGDFEPGERSPDPTLLYLGRLKRYKRIELLLDVVAPLPEATLDLAGDGDHRSALEAEIDRRGLGERVRVHGYVSERRKLELLQRSWVNLTASSAEGWCLSVMEAAACATPSVALAVGGLAESIDHGRSGLLARTPEELVGRTREVVRDPELRERLGRKALERARELDWDATARRTLDSLARARAHGSARAGTVRDATRSDTGRAAGLAAAVIASNAIALGFTIAFARLLGADGYGSLAALLSAFIILMVPGSALQVAVAREVSAELADGGAAPGASVRRWLTRLLGATGAVVVAAIATRDVLATAIDVDQQWAAGAVPVMAMLWTLVCVERGALQGLRRYRDVGLSIVGEAGLRLGFGLALFGVGMDVTGAFLGTAAALMAVAAVLWARLLPLLPAPATVGDPARLRALLAQSWAPVLGLTLLFALQEVHVIVMKHEATDAAAGSWAVAAVAAKAIIWVAVGLGMYLLPEVARRSRHGEDARPILGRTLALIAAAAIPMILIFAVAAEPLLGAVFGSDLTGAAGALPWLGLAMALLASAYLSVQYLLALGRASFIWVLGVAAAAEVAILLVVGTDLTTAALALMSLQLACAAAMLALSFGRRGRGRGEPPRTPIEPAPVS